MADQGQKRQRRGIGQALTFCVAVVATPVGAFAQVGAGSPDLFSLTFAPGPFSADAARPLPGGNDGNAPVEAASANAGLERLLDAIAEAEQSIADEAARNGPQSRALVDRYRSLAALYEELGDPFLAAAAFEQARAVVRMNDGLRSLDQADIVEQTIEMLESVGAYGDSDSLQDELLDLARRNQDESDQRVASIFAAVADQQMEAVQAYIDDDVWPRDRRALQPIEGSGWEASTEKAGRQRALTALAVIGDRYDAAIEAALAGGDAEFGDSLETGISEIYELVDTANDFLEVGPLPRMERDGASWEPEPPVGDREFAAAALNRARRLYSAAMQAAYREGNRSEYFALDDLFVETYFFELAHPELASDVVVDPRVPHPLESVLRARVADRLVRGASAFEVARSVVELADALGNHESLELYQAAHDFLIRKEGSAAEIAALFDPDVPVLRRAFGPEDMTAFDASRAYRGYIDVEVETGRYGQVRSVDVVGSSPGTIRAIQRILSKRVSASRFRPRFADGEPVRSDRFAVRYFYDHKMLE